MNSLSPVSRGEREIWKQFLLFREEREKVEFPFPSFEKRKRNQTNILDFREEKEKSEIVCSSALTPLYMYFSLLLKAAKCRKNYVSSEMTMTQTLLMWLWPVRMVNGHQLEAHKVILDGFIPQTTINTHCSKLEDFIFHSKRWLTKVRGRHLRSQKLFYKTLKIERRMRNCSTKSWKSRGEREIVQQNLENREEKEKFNTKILWTERRKRNDFSKSWKSRGERVLKIHFSSSRGKTKSNFSSRISRDRDSCQGLEKGPFFLSLP